MAELNARVSALLRRAYPQAASGELEFGRYHGQLLVADEISPDSARFWDARTHEPMDLDRFRRDLGGVEQAYQDLLHRMMGE